ncbi:hypothetical protein PLESTB_001355100 [Pleodorina starrii]|uniref:Uncharacterized protein n=1 Tax=Pleodorina starrii TaxID=330485 RepID=A0A9W6BUF8_9CHLO|nr:hypothetical protein PLESTB_001355100 [Pleodorina starrii]
MPHFVDALSKAAAYRATACGSSSVTSANGDIVSTLSQFLDPEVYTTYLSCMNLYSSGIQVAVTPVFNNPKSISLNLRYTPPKSGAKAYLTGSSVYPPKAATCTIQSFSAVAGPKPADPFKIELTPDTTFTVTCQLTADSTNNNTYTDVNIYT